MSKHFTNHTETSLYKKPKLEAVQETNEKKLEKLQNSYLKEGLSQQITYYLKYLSKNPKIPSEHKSQALIQIFEECCKDFLLNDLEIVLWGIYQQKIVWQEKTRTPKIPLLYSAYASKQLLNLDCDLVTLTTFISTKYPGFLPNYKTWSKKHIDSLTLSLRDFNKSFKCYMSLPVKDIIDYNYYVDDLLHIAPPSGISEKESNLEFEIFADIDTEEPKLPELLNLGSVLTCNDLPVPLILENWKSIDISKDLDIENIENIDLPLKPYLDEGSLVN